MKKSTKTLSLLSAAALLSIGALVTVGNAGEVSLHADDCDHVGNHYAGKAASSTETGVKEFWTCCKCHAHFIEAPTGGSWTDQAVTPEITDTEDDRFVKATPTITIKANGTATTSAKSYETNALPEFTYAISVNDANVTYWYSKDDGATNLGQTAPTVPGTYAYNVQVNASGKYNRVHAFVWYIINAADKIAVNSCVLTFNGSDYSANNWSAKEFVSGAPAPTWSLTTDPADAAQYIDTWITKNEVPVEGWPTEVGEYVFCVGIRSSNTHVKFGTGSFTKNFYVGFSIVAA